MPLKPAAKRKHLHTRHITCEGFMRDDGLWDIEARWSTPSPFALRTAWAAALPKRTNPFTACCCG